MSNPIERLRLIQRSLRGSNELPKIRRLYFKAIFHFVKRDTKNYVRNTKYKKSKLEILKEYLIRQYSYPERKMRLFLRKLKYRKYRKYLSLNARFRSIKE